MVEYICTRNNTSHGTAQLRPHARCASHPGGNQLRYTSQSAWWTINTEGQADRVGDHFTITFSDPVTGQLVHRTTQRITEAVPGKRLAWTVTECHMSWLKDAEEWRGTTMVFDIVAVPEGARIDFTHIGLTPQLECFKQCERGWAYFLLESLQELIATGTGRPDTSGRNHMDTIGHVSPTNA